ncbi:CCN family member 2-like [Tenrec ecaudatus]|uniref:CCN family member 2-like n=1 Tax=Tenrec ecaudatus TaxID=94439 RepID=UPI003F591888
MCAKQPGESCEEPDLCDYSKLLYCDLGTPPNRTTGVYKSREGSPCYCRGRSYKHGRISFIGCRMKCICTHRVWVCEPLCPENLGPPIPDCFSPWKVKPPGKCCEEWVCEESKELTRVGTTLANYLEDRVSLDPAMMRPHCQGQTTEWSSCSRTCGMGISTGVTNDNANCTVEKQSRLCIDRSCQPDLEEDIKVT